MRCGGVDDEEGVVARGVEVSATRKEWSHAVRRRRRRGGSGRTRCEGVGDEEGVVGVSDEEGWFPRIVDVPATTRGGRARCEGIGDEEGLVARDVEASATRREWSASATRRAGSHALRRCQRRRGSGRAR